MQLGFLQKVKNKNLWGFKLFKIKLRKQKMEKKNSNESTRKELYAQNPMQKTVDWGKICWGGGSVALK